MLPFRKNFPPVIQRHTFLSRLFSATSAATPSPEGETTNKLSQSPPPKKEVLSKRETAQQVEAHYASPLAEFFDQPVNWGVRELRPKQRPGREWTKDELRQKSGPDLHKLWYVLLKERNMLLTMQEAYKVRGKAWSNPERLDRVNESMKNIEFVVHERNDAFFRLETGHGSSPPTRRVTSFMGFTTEEPIREHYEPLEQAPPDDGVNPRYEIPFLDDDAYMMQKLWAEKAHMKEQIAVHDRYLASELDMDLPFRLRRSLRRKFNTREQLPEQVVSMKSSTKAANK